MAQFVDLPVYEIVMDTDTQSRVSMDVNTIDEYAEAMARGDTFPAIVVFQEEGSYEPILADGWYRTMAAKEAGITSLLAEVREGDLDDAILYAAGANETHGIRRTNKDKRNAVMMLLGREKWKVLSNRQIAEAARVGDDLVRAIKNEQLPETATGGDKGGVVIGKDGKKYKANKAKVEKKSESVQRGVFDVMEDISKLTLVLPRDPRDAAAEMAKDNQCLSAGLADSIAWWFSSYAKCIKEFTDDEELGIAIPNSVAK